MLSKPACCVMRRSRYRTIFKILSILNKFRPTPMQEIVHGYIVHAIHWLWNVAKNFIQRFDWKKRCSKKKLCHVAIFILLIMGDSPLLETKWKCNLRIFFLPSLQPLQGYFLVSILRRQAKTECSPRSTRPVKSRGIFLYQLELDHNPNVLKRLIIKKVKVNTWTSH